MWQTDGQTDRQTDRQTDWTIHRAAWSQLKICFKYLFVLNAYPRSTRYSLYKLQSMHTHFGYLLFSALHCKQKYIKSHFDYEYGNIKTYIHRGWNKTSAIMQMTFSNQFSCIKLVVFSFRFHCILLLRFNKQYASNGSDYGLVPNNDKRLSHWGRVTHICVSTKFKLVKLMTCCLTSPKPLSEPMLKYC